MNKNQSYRLIFHILLGNIIASVYPVELAAGLESEDGYTRGQRGVSTMSISVAALLIAPL